MTDRPHTRRFHISCSWIYLIISSGVSGILPSKNTLFHFRYPILSWLLWFFTIPFKNVMHENISPMVCSMQSALFICINIAFVPLDI